MATRYFACPAHRCRAPGRFFDTETSVLAFARQAAAAYLVPYSTWRVHYGQWTLLRLFQPEDQPNQEQDQR
jgi:hypothetical protein